MAPTILVIGATGNTGRSTVETLSKLVNSNSPIQGHRIIAITRSAQSDASQKLAELAGVEVIEKLWTTISADWLREHGVVRAFIATALTLTLFATESTFYFAALNAGVEYIVRISTTACNVKADCGAHYARQHWAVEQLLESPPYAALKWTSLQPNCFPDVWYGASAYTVARFRETGVQEPLRLIADEDTPVGVIDPYDVGVFAGRLLGLKDTSPHHGARYELNGRDNITGRQILEVVEETIGEKIKEVYFKDKSIVDVLAANVDEETRPLIRTMEYAVLGYWEGICSTATTSPEFLEIAPPSKSAVEILKATLAA